MATKVDLKTEQLQQLCKKFNVKEPIVLTQHGKSAAVLMDVTEYERFSKKLELLEDLLEAKQQVQQGETYTMEEAQDRIDKQLSKWK